MRIRKAFPRLSSLNHLCLLGFELFDSVCFLGGGGEGHDFCEEEDGSFVYAACCILGFVLSVLLTVMCSVNRDPNSQVLPPLQLPHKAPRKT